ncbi:hypothetical protein MRX96_032594 [Rhipicephalus microplus]
MRTLAATLRTTLLRRGRTRAHTRPMAGNSMNGVALNEVPSQSRPPGRYRRLRQANKRRHHKHGHPRLRSLNH